MCVSQRTHPKWSNNLSRVCWPIPPRPVDLENYLSAQCSQPREQLTKYFLNALESSEGEETSVSILRNKKLIFGCEHFELSLDRHEAKQTYGNYTSVVHVDQPYRRVVDACQSGYITRGSIKEACQFLCRLSSDGSGRNYTWVSVRLLLF